jgi:hypothetical protein
MKIVLGIILAGFMLTTAPAGAQDADRVAKAEASALAWLALTDVGDYPRSWDQAAGYFQAAVSIIQYDAQFEHKDSAIETVTPLLETDGSWKVSGYFIK